MVFIGWKINISRRLRWFEHKMRRDEEQLVKKVVDMEVGQILVGRPMKS